MRKALVAIAALSTSVLFAPTANAQVAMSAVRVSADRLPMTGEDTTNYWGIGGGTASAANRDAEHGTPRSDAKARAEDDRK